MEKIKILYDHQIKVSQKFGGISRYFNEISDLSIYGVETQTISDELYLSSISETFYKKIFNRIKRKFYVKSNNSNFSFDSLPKINSFIDKNDCDIFHPTYYNPYFLKVIKKPFVLTVHDMIHEIYPEYFYNSKVSYNKKLLCEKAEKIIVVSETTKNDLIEIFNIQEDKITVILHGSNFHKIKPKIIKKLPSKYILFTGQRGLYKNFFTMLIGIKEILLNDKDLNVVCSGSHFNEYEMNWFDLLGIKNKIIHYYCQTDEELAFLYQNAVCFIFPSLYEGFGFPLLEAFASGCPIVSSNGGSLTEIGANAVQYFNPKNIKSIHDSVYKVLNDESLRQELIYKGHQEYLKYSWEKCRKETANIYSNILK